MATELELSQVESKTLKGKQKRPLQEMSLGSLARVHHAAVREMRATLARISKSEVAMRVMVWRTAVRWSLRRDRQAASGAAAARQMHEAGEVDGAGGAYMEQLEVNRFTALLP